MDHRIFINYIEICHKSWLGEFLNIPVQIKTGIDLLDDKLGIELKNRYQKYSKSFAVHAYQVDLFKKDNPDIELSWGLLLYDLQKEPPMFEDNDDFEQEVTSRNIWFIEWDWIYQFPVQNPKTGPYRYASLSKSPSKSEFEEFQVNGATTINVHKKCPVLLERIDNILS